MRLPALRGIALYAVVAAVLEVPGCGGSLPPARPTVAAAEVVRGRLQVRSGEVTTTIQRWGRLEQDAAVSTAADARGRVRLDGGAKLLLGGDTEVQVGLASVRLGRGRVWVDATSSDETTVETADGTLGASNATFSVIASQGATLVYCASGEVTVRSERGGARVQQGESLRLTRGAAPRPEPEALWDDWTGGLADPTSSLAAPPTSVGLLAGRRLEEAGTARAPLPIRSHDVRVTVQGDVATTDVVQAFFNARSDMLEAEYVVRIPRDAIVTGFSVAQGAADFGTAAVCPYAMQSGGQLVWTDSPGAPSALTWDGPGRLRARVYPVPPGGIVRVRLTYAEWLDRRAGVRTYVYPMAGEGESMLLGEFSLEVDLREAGASAVRAGMGAQSSAERVSLRRSDFRPRADFYLDLIDEAGGEDGAVAYVAAGAGGSDEDRYVLVDVPTAAAQAAGDEARQSPLDVVLLVDVSGGTSPEDLEVARAVVEAALQHLESQDRVALLLADVTAHPPAGGSAELAAAAPASRETMLETLARTGLGGATDLGRSISDAAVLVAGRPLGTVVYIGDGIPTTGGLTATAIRASLAAIESPPRLFAVGVGEAANMDLLQTLFGDGARPVSDRTEASQVMMDILAEASQPTIRGVTLDLGPAVERLYPSGPVTLDEGASLRLAGRVRGALPRQVVLRGHRRGEPFEQTLELDSREAEGSAADYVRRRWATERYAELADEGTSGELLASLASRFAVVSPWTPFVVGMGPGCSYAPLRGFDRGPAGAWGEGEAAQQGGFIAASRPRRDAALESTWSPRVPASPPAASRGGDGGVARAAVERTLSTSTRAPMLCYERRLLARPELAGDVAVRVDVGGDGRAQAVRVERSGLADPEVERCLVSEVSGLAFPATGGGTVTATHVFHFVAPARELGRPRGCSDTSRLPLAERRWLWQERLRAQPSLDGALGVYRDAEQKCELGTWAARRALLDMMLVHVGDLTEQVRLYQAFPPGTAVASHLKRAILLAARTPTALALVRTALGLEPSLDWNEFAWRWYASSEPVERLALVRRWLEAAPSDIDLRIRLLRLLEETRAIAEARRVARDLADDPLADAQARAAIAEFWMRQDDLDEARRALSGIVENAPFDPWAHRRVGDLYLASGWGEGAYREYLTLSQLSPGDPDVLLLLARAAAAAGRTDEALRLEQRLSESVAPGADEGAATFARLWTAVRLARLREEAGNDAALRAAVARRERASGLLRDRPVLFAALTWGHPDDRPSLLVRYPNAPAEAEWEAVPLRGDAFGIEALRVQDSEPGDIMLEVRRGSSDPLRDVVAELLVTTMPGTEDERIARAELRLPAETAAVRFRVTAEGGLEPVPMPAALTVAAAQPPRARPATP